MLIFTIGADVHAVTIIVAAFMAGLGIGSVLGGAVADRLDGRRRLWAFAACELGIAAFALVSATVFYDLFYLRLGASTLSRLALGSLSFLVLLWPTVLMGMSLPLASRILTTDVRQPDEWVPVLYGWNTLGAALGALFAVSVLFRRMDFASILIVGASLNAAFGLTALMMARRPKSLTDDQARPETLQSPAADRPQASLGLSEWMAIYALSGFIALSLEVVWFRLLGVVLKSTALTFGLLLTMYLGGLGVGSLIAHSAWARRLPAARSFLMLQTVIPVYSALALSFLVFVIGLPAAGPLAEYLSGYAGRSFEDFLTPLSLTIMIGIPALLMGLPTFFMGLSFGSIQRAVQVDVEALGRRVGWLQASNIFGAVIGTLLTGFVMLDRLGTSGTMRLLVVLGAFFLWVLFRGTSGGGSPQVARGAGRVAAAMALAAAIIAIPSSDVLWPRLHGIQQGGALYTEDGTGLALLRPEPGNGTTIMFANGLGHSRLPYGGIHTVLGALPVLMHPNPVDIAVIGLGSGDTTYAVAGRSETSRIDNIEIIAAELSSLRQLAGSDPNPGVTRLLQDPRIQFHALDGRVFLLRSAKRYDLIEADALRPRTAFSGNLYSVEYFQLLRARLKPQGYAVTWIPTPRTRDSLVAAFPHVLIAGQVGFGSDTPIQFDVEAIRQRMNHQFTRAHYAAAGLDLARELAEYFKQRPQVFGPDFDRRSLVDLNHDLFPKDEFSRRGP
jgi:MFS family permease